MKTQPNVMMAFACEKVSSEPGTPMSFQNVLDGIEADDFPAPSARWLAIFCFFSPIETTVANCRVAIEYGDGELIGQTKVRDMQFTASNPISRHVVAFAGFSWPYPGWYRVKFIAERDTVLALFPMLVQRAPEAPGSN